MRHRVIPHQTTRAAVAAAALTALCAIAIGTVAAAQAPTCIPARVTPASSIRVGPGVQRFDFDVNGSGQTFLCVWAPVSSDAGWLTTSFVYLLPGFGFGGYFTAEIAENTTGAARTGHYTLNNAMGTITVVQDSAPCVVVPATIPVGRAGGTITVPVQTTTPDCGWASFLTGPPQTWAFIDQPRSVASLRQSVGPASLVLQVSSNENGTGPRSVVANVGGVAVTIEQETPLCVFSMSPATAAFPAGGGSGTITLSGSGSDCSYTAATSGNVTITSAGSGVAPATISYTVPSATADVPTTPSITVRNATLQITQDAPSIATDVPPTFPFSPGGLSFGVFRSGSGSIASRTARVAITNTTTPASGWAATVDQPWVTLSGSSGPTPGALTIGVDPAQTASLPLGTTSAVVSLASPIASEGARRVPIWLTVVDASTSAAPGGSFDSPTTSTVQSGAIPVTGWALDDVGIQRIVISRAAMAGEPAGAEVYIGDATRVRGARPDAAARRSSRIGPAGQDLFLLQPEATEAGWGYMLLSNVLPGGGNGPLTLFADAYDLDGRVTRLGTRRVTLDNANATRPFGTIDVPAQGATVSGTIVNQGWVLTPQMKTIPIDGSTIKVYIDGVLRSPVTSYNLPRPDVKALFPGLQNSDGPGGQLSIDTTTLADGVHTIAWGVIDSNGDAEGIGSRYFTVQNGSASLIETPDTARAAATVARMPALPTEPWSRAGVDDLAWATRVETNARGKRTVRASRGQRIELFLDPTLRAACGSYTGHLLSGDVAGPLPAGASLDAERGIFRWQPVAETSGTFEFVFVQRGCDGVERRVSIAVRLE